MRQCKHGWIWGVAVLSMAVAPVLAQQKPGAAQPAQPAPAQPAPAQRAPAQPASVLPGRPDQQDAPWRVGEWFESKAAGIALRVPEGATEVRRAGVPDLIAEFVNEKQGMMVRVGKLEFRTAQPLADTKTIDGAKQVGILGSIVSDFQRENPAAEVLRNEITQMHGRDVGLVAFRFSLGTSRRMMQQAIFKYNDTYYYQVTMTSITSKDAPAAGQIDPREKAAADLFSDIVDSVQIIDRTEIAKDQEARLLRTRDLMEELRGPKTMNKVLMPEQWLRLTRDGKDIGYSYVAEERTKEDGREGVLISIRSRSVAGPDNQVDVVSRMFISDFWKHESWEHVVTTQAGKKSDSVSELGMSDMEQKYRLDTTRKFGEGVPADDPKQPPVTKVMKYSLEVRTVIGKTGGKPVTRELPEWYLPQAIRHLLPRMLPLDKPQTYMFVNYVSETHQLMTRYVDVGEAKEISFNGQNVKAIAVKDRVGLEGIPTTYYVTPDGKYLGSQTEYQVGNATSVIRVLPSDEATLRKIWENAKLSKPEASEMPVLPDTFK